MIFIGDEFEGEAYTLGTAFGRRDAVIPNHGIIVVVPRVYRQNGPGLGWAETIGSPTIAGAINIMRYAKNHPNASPLILEETLSHEFGHIFMGDGHPWTLTGESVLERNPTVGPADKKQAMILNNKEFVNDYGQEYAQIDHYGRILGLYLGKEDYKVTLWGGIQWEYEEILNPDRNF